MSPRPVLGGRLLIATVTALVLGTALGFAAGRSTATAEPEDAPAQIIAEGELADLLAGPVRVLAERVVLPSGFHSRHFHGGPTFNFVDSGTVVIDSAGQRVRYGAGEFFLEPAGRIHAITVLDDARLRVLRLLPPGVEATTAAP